MIIVKMVEYSTKKTPNILLIVMNRHIDIQSKK